MNKLTSEMQEVIDEHGKLGPLPIETLTAENARQQPEIRDAVLGVLQNHLITRAVKGVVVPVAKVWHERIKSQDGEIDVRFYNPSPDKENLPIVVYFHGGGWVIASLNTYDASCRALAVGAECIVASVAYRQAPEHPYPAAHNDAYYAFKWIRNNAKKYGGDAKRVAIAGESAGGNLAASVCIRCRDEGFDMPVHQVLIYPVVDMDMTRPSYEENKDAKPLNVPMMKWFFKQYFGQTPKEQWALPLKSQDLTLLPKATIIAAEVDPLRSEGLEFAGKLKLAGVDVFYKQFDGVTHEFFGLAAIIPEAKEAVTDVCSELKKTFSSMDDAVVTDPDMVFIPIPS